MYLAVFEVSVIFLTVEQRVDPPEEQSTQLLIRGRIMIRLTMRKREFIYWLSGLTGVPVMLFVAGVAFGTAIYTHTPQPGIASSHGPAEPTRASMLAAIEIRGADDDIERNKSRQAELDQTANVDAHIEQTDASLSGHVAELATSSPTPGAESTATEQAYSVQIGSFSNEKNAVSMAKYLRTKGYRVKTLVVNDTNAMKYHYKVRVGYYPSYTEAAAAAADYRLRERATAFIANDRGNAASVNYL